MRPRLLERYRGDVVPKLAQEFGYANTMQVPRLEKIVVNIGMGEAGFAQEIGRRQPLGRHSRWAPPKPPARNGGRVVGRSSPPIPRAGSMC